MRQLTMFVIALLMSTLSLANSSGSQSTLNAKLGTVWKSYQSGQHQSTRNDLTIVYGGEDMSNRPILVPHSKTV